MKLYNVITKFGLLSLAILYGQAVLAAEDINIAQKPLAVETGGVSPNVMLILDDSGSMSCVNGSSCADDVFYAPGYDANKEYRCTKNEANTNLLKPKAGNVLTVYVSMKTDKGVPYFKYGNDFYTWGKKLGNSYEDNVISEGVCFDPDDKFQVKLKANKRQTSCSAYYYQDRSSTKKNWSNDKDSCASGRTIANNLCRVSTTCKTPVDEYLYSTLATEEQDGNFLNWYFSSTIAEWGDNSDTGGYKDYGESGLNSGYWTEDSEKQFITDDVTFCYLYSGTYYNCAGYTGTLTAGSVYPEYTKLNGSNKNANGKTWFPPMPSYASNEDMRYSWNSGTHKVFDSNTQHNHRNEDDAYGLRGMKPGVSNNQFRVHVSIDVGKKVVRDLDNAFVSVADFWAYYNSTTATKISKSSSSQHLLHSFVELDAKGKPAQTKTNKESLIASVAATGGHGGTPTAKTLAAAGRFFFNGWDEASFQYKKTASTAAVSKKIKDILGLEFTSTSKTNAKQYQASQKFITADNWCQKNAIAVLTDGAPSGDGRPSGLDGYIPRGTSLPSSSSDHYNLTMVAGALYDQDFLPNLSSKKTEKTNIETFLIAMGDKSVLEKADFQKAGLAAGGGVNNYYPANNGAKIAQAFKDIMNRISGSAASITAIAVSAVSEMRADNYAVQATYATDYWTSELKAFNLNRKGQFINEGDDPDDESKGWDSSAGIVPKWEANSKLNETYIVGDEAQRKKVRTRKVYTWHPDLKVGVRFGADNMTRPNSETAQFTPFANLPESMRLDLSKRAGANAQEQYDLMMYLLGDISNEDGFEYSGCAANDCNEKYRRRGVYVVNASTKKVTSVSKGGFLGDIVDSSPIYVKEPPRPWDNKNFSTEEQRYSHYKEQMKDRTAMVYVGTNRGFLHGFAVEGSSAGQEIFAYMPNALTSLKTNEGYHYLASKNYDHRFYVDLTPTVSDVFMDFYSTGSQTASPEWRTILIGGLRGGGKGYFALDITCPFKTTNTGSTCDDESFSGNNVLWEFTDKDDPDLGYTFGEPVIAKVFYSTGESDDGKNANGKGRWAAIVPNGYNSNDGRAVLFVLFLDGGRDGVWTKGKDYIKLYAGSSSEDKPTNKNGLSSATAIDLDGDGIVDQIYAGDVKGQMWSFDVRQSVVYQEN